MPVPDDGKGPLAIDYLANHRESIPDLARYYFEEWESVYRQRGMGLDDVAVAISRRGNTDKIPLALVALLAGQVVGTVSLKDQDLEIRPDLGPWLGGLFVLPEHRGRGIGTVLIRRLVEEARRLRVSNLYLWTPSAERLYSRLEWSRMEVADYCGYRISIMGREISGLRTDHSKAGLLSFVRYDPLYLEGLLALHRTAVEGMDLGMSREEDEADLLAIEERYLRCGGEFLIGLMDGQVVVMGGFRPRSEKAAELKRMRVRRELQGQGLGTRLLHELERRAMASGFVKMELDTARQRPLTLAFYRQHGYQVTGTGWYGNVEVVRFEKHLPTARAEKSVSTPEGTRPRD